MSVLARLWASRRERPWLVAGVALFLVALLLHPLVDAWLRAAGVAPPIRAFDFGTYLEGVERWRTGGTVYRRSEGGGFHGTFLYPPVVLLLLRPFDAVPFRTAHLLWSGGGLVVLWVGLQLAADEFGADLAPVDRVVLLFALVGFQPLLLALKMGQTAGLLAGLLALALWLLRRGERRDGRRARVASGALTAAVCVVKPAYAPVCAHLLADRDRFAGGVAAVGALAAVSLAAFGLEIHRTYLEVLAWGVAGGGPLRQPALWLAPYFRPLFVLRGEALALRVGGSLAVAALAVAAGRADADHLAFALGVAAMPLLTPLPYTYYLVAALPAALVCLAVEAGRGRDGHPLAAVAALACLHAHAYGLKLAVSVLPEAGPAVHGLLQPGLWGVLVLVGVAAAAALRATLDARSVPATLRDAT
ncbi:MAG: glycosyltransferase 87 family protein [Haloferacaceae archaeon]